MNVLQIDINYRLFNYFFYNKNQKNVGSTQNKIDYYLPIMSYYHIFFISIGFFYVPL